MAVKGVFIAIGYIPAVDLGQKIGLELTPDGYFKQENIRTNIPGVYAVRCDRRVQTDCNRRGPGFGSDFDDL